MNLFQSIGLTFNRNNYEYIKKEIEKAKDSWYVTDLINKMNPSLIDLDLIKLAIDKGYRFRNYTPKEILDNEEIVLYLLENSNNVKFIIDHANSSIITLDLVKKYIDEGKYYVDSNTSKEYLNNREFMQYALLHKNGFGRINDILNIIDKSFLNDEIVIKTFKNGYKFGIETPEFIKINPKCLAYNFVDYELDNSSLQYEDVLDGLKQYLKIVFRDNENADEKFKSLNSDELKKYVDQFVYEAIDNEFQSNSLQFTLINNNLIKNNKDYIEYIIKCHQKNPKSPYLLSKIFQNVNPTILNVDYIKKLIDTGLSYDYIPDVYKNNDDIISEYLSKGKYYVFNYIKDKNKEELDRIIKLAIDKGMTFYFDSFGREIENYIRNNNEVCIYAVSKGNFRALIYLNEISDEINKKIDEIVYSYIDNAEYTDEIKKNFVYFIDKINDSNLIQTIVDTIYDYNYLPIETIKKIIDKGYKYHNNTPSYLMDNCILLYAAAKGDKRAIELTQNNISYDDINHMNLLNLMDEDFFKYIIDNGYYINNNTPYFIRYNYEFIKIYLESSKINLNSVNWIAENIDEELLSQNNFELFKLCIDKGYSLNSYTKDIFIKSLEVVKYAANKGDKYAINKLFPYFIENKQIDEDELYSIILSAFNTGYCINYDTPNFIKNDYYLVKELIKITFKNEIINSIFENINEKLLIDNNFEILTLAFKNGYIINDESPKYLLDEKYIKYALTNGKFEVASPSKLNSNLSESLMFSSDEFMKIFENYMKNISFDNINVCLMILASYNKNNEKNDKLNNYYNYILENVKNILVEKFKDKSLIDLYLSMVLSNQRNPLNFIYINNLKKLKIVVNYCDLNSIEAEQNCNNITMEIINKGNKKQIKKIISLLKNIGVGDDKLLLLAINIYLSIGFARANDLLNHKYGQVNEIILLKIFKDIIPSDVIFIPDGNGFKPEINEQLINLTFGENYKIQNTPIKNLLNNFADKNIEIKTLIENVKKDLNLTQSEKEIKIKELEKQFNIYVSNTKKFFDLFSNIFNEWDIIEEEFLKSKLKSKLSLKLNLSKTIELCKMIEAKRNVPELEPCDEELMKSDVFDYALHDTQFVDNVSKVPSRVIELSRRMDYVKFKKFPNVELSQNKYKIKVYGPQDRRILSGGYRSRCCFRARGNADDSGKDTSLLNYCVSTEYGGAIEIVDDKGKTVMFSPLLRNGNVLMIHSIETKIGDTLPKDCYELLVEYAKESIRKATEAGDDISFVTITDLHYLDKSYTKGQLSQSKKFEIFDNNNRFTGMYNNLSFNHMILSFKEGKTQDDIEYGSVDISYEFDIPKIFGYVQVNDEEKALIQKLDKIKEKYISKANERYNAKKIGKEEESYELLREIKNLKREYLIIYKKLAKIRNNTDIYSDYKKGLSYIASTNRKIGIDIDIDNNLVSEIIYGNDWYIIITVENNIIANYLEGSKADLMDNLNKLKMTKSFNSIYVNNNDEVIIKK